MSMELILCPFMYIKELNAAIKSVRTMEELLYF